MVARFSKRFSIRALLAAIAVVGMACGLVARQLVLIRAEHAAACLLQGAVEADTTTAYGSMKYVMWVSRDPPTSAIGRLLYKLASSPGKVHHVRITGERSLRALENQSSALPNVEWLEIAPITRNGDPDVLTDRHITVAARFDSLDRLIFEGCFSDGLDISPLRNHHIGEISIRSPAISNRIIRDLASLNTLGLDILCQSSDDTFSSLAFESFSCSNVRSIRIVGAAVDDQGFEHISRASKLRSLALWGPGITDEGLRLASEQLHVSDLNLRGSAITDTSIETLSAMKGLTFIDVRDTKISSSGITRLRALRPDLKVQ